ALRLPRVSRPRFDPAGMTSGAIDEAVRRSMEEFGSVYEVDEELLARLQPDLVLTQAVCEVCAVPTGAVEAAVSALPPGVEIVSLDAHDTEGIIETFEQVATAAGEPGRGAAAAGRLRERVAAVVDRVAGADRPKVLLLEWLDPPFAPGHWVPEMVEIAGGRNLIGEEGERSRQIDWSEVGDLDPDVLLIEPCGFSLEEARGDADRHRSRLLGAAPRAIEGGEAWLLHSAWFSRSGPRIVEGIEVLAHILHPDRFPHDALPGRAERWPR
ncbi:MAG TPA: ABC transporter substrate-binding protein, partial [Longimicrobiaceae bacterium]|nr:ABC transporter substrate-binding protein [Longimicrobiaceae bacterium]